MVEAFLNILCRRKWATLLAAILILAVSAWFVPGLTVSDSPERWLPSSISDAWERFGEHFEHGNTIVIALEFQEGVKDEDLSYLKSLRSDLETIPGILRVIDLSLLADQVERVPLTVMLKDPDSSQEDLYTPYRGVLYDDPRIWSTEQEERGKGPGESPSRTLLTVLELDAELHEEVEENRKQEILDQRRRLAVKDLYQQLEKHEREDVTFHVVGGVIIQYELEKIARRTVITFVPLSLLLMLLALGVGFRSVSAVGIALIGGIWSMLVLLGMVTLMGWTFDVVTVSAPPMMAVIVIATTVHFSHYYSKRNSLPNGAKIPDPAERATQREDSPSATGSFVGWVAVPCFGAALAAGVGFLMLGFNELSPAREMGIELFFGAILAFFGAFFMWLIVHPFRAAKARLLSLGNLQRVRRIVVAWPRRTIAFMLILIAFLVYASGFVQVDADPFSFFQPKSNFAQAIQHLTERKFGYHILDIVLVPRNRPGDPKERALERRKDLAAATAFQRKIKERAEVRNVISALELQARMQSLETLAADFRRAMVFQDMFKNWTVDRSGGDAIRITFSVADSEAGFRPLMEDVQKALPKERFDCICTGTVASVLALADGLIGGIMHGLGVALVAMALLCLILFRSARLALIAFFPNAFPILFIFGLMGVFGIPLNSGSAMVATIALGMGLNDTVHFIMRYQRRYRNGDGPEMAVAQTFGEIGRPLVLTSMVNCFGFAIFLLSDFRPMYYFGLLSSIAMIAALVGDLVFLPNLLKLFDKKSYAKV